MNRRVRIKESIEKDQMSQLSVTLFRLITSLTLCCAPSEYFTKDLKSVGKVNEIHLGKKKIERFFWQSLFYPDKGLLLYHLQSWRTAKLVDIQDGVNIVSLHLGDIPAHSKLLSCPSRPPLQMPAIVLWKKKKKKSFSSLSTNHVGYSLGSLIKNKNLTIFHLLEFMTRK